MKKEQIINTKKVRCKKMKKFKIENINDVDRIIYEGYKLLDNRIVTADIILPTLDCLSLFSKIRVAQNLYDIIDKLQENNEIYLKYLTEAIERGEE